MIRAVISSSGFTSGACPEVLITVTAAYYQHFSTSGSARWKRTICFRWRSAYGIVGTFIIGVVLSSFLWSLNSSEKTHMSRMSMEGGCRRWAVTKRSRASGYCWQR